MQKVIDLVINLKQKHNAKGSDPVDVLGWIFTERHLNAALSNGEAKLVEMSLAEIIRYDRSPDTYQKLLQVANFILLCQK